MHVATSPHVSKTVSLLTSGMEEHNNMIILHPDTETCMIMIKWDGCMGIGSYEGRPWWRLRHRFGTDDIQWRVPFKNRATGTRRHI